MLKTIPLLLETVKCAINKLQRRLPGPCNWKSEKMTSIFKNLKNMWTLSKKIAKIWVIQKFKPTRWQLKIFHKTYYPTLNEFFWPPGLKQLE